MSVPRGVWCHLLSSLMFLTPSPVDRMTDASENITSLAVGKILVQLLVNYNYTNDNFWTPNVPYVLVCMWQAGQEPSLYVSVTAIAFVLNSDGSRKPHLWLGREVTLQIYGKTLFQSEEDLERPLSVICRCQIPACACACLLQVTCCLPRFLCKPSRNGWSEFEVWIPLSFVSGECEINRKNIQ